MLPNLQRILDGDILGLRARVDKMTSDDGKALKGRTQDSTEDAEVGAVIKDVQKYEFDESRKIGVTGAVFLILNKMIGTGSKPASHAARLLLSLAPPC